MTTDAKASKPRWLNWAAGAALLAVLCIVAPPFHIVKIGAARAQEFDAAAAARQFWNTQLFTAQPVDAAVLLPALAADAEAAAAAHGKTAGMATAPAYFLRGTGTVTQSDADGATISLSGGTANLLLIAGPVSGNAVRDCTGLLSGSAHANSQDFNAIAGELNRIVEQQVQPSVKSLKSGTRITFTACAAPQRHQVKSRPLKVIPLKLEIQP